MKRCLRQPDGKTKKKIQIEKCESEVSLRPSRGYSVREALLADCQTSSLLRV